MKKPEAFRLNAPMDTHGFATRGSAAATGQKNVFAHAMKKFISLCAFMVNL